MTPTTWSSAPEQCYDRCVRYRAHAGFCVCAPYEEYIGFGDFMGTTGSSRQLLILVGWAGKARWNASAPDTDTIGFETATEMGRPRGSPSLLVHENHVSAR